MVNRMSQSCMHFRLLHGQESSPVERINSATWGADSEVATRGVDLLVTSRERENY